MNVYEKNTVEFVTVGVEFCAFVEKASEKTFDTFVPILHHIHTAVKAVASFDTIRHFSRLFP